MSPADVRLILLLLASSFVVILNETTMGVALAPIMDDFGITASAGQWLTTAFLLTMAVVIPVSGWLLERLGTRTAFATAMTTFTLGTGLAALAPTFEVLLAARVVQACGTAVMMPLLMTTVMRIVPAGQRGRVMGNVSLVIAAAPALGPSAAGLVLRWFSWHWIFALVLPIALVALVVGLRWVRGVAGSAEERLDLASLPLAVLAFGGVVYGLTSLGEAARQAPPVSPWVPLGVGLAALGLFVARQGSLVRRGGHPLLDVRVMAVRDFTSAVVLMCLAMFAMFGVMILLPLYVQRVLGLEPLDAGLLTLPGALGMGLLGPVVGRWYDRTGARVLVVPGLALAAGSLLLLALGPERTWLVLVAHVVMSIGMALVFTPLFTFGLGALSGPLVPHGSAAVGTLQQLAGAAGTATFVALMTMRETSAASAGAEPSAALAAGVHLAFWVGAGVMALGTVAALWLRRDSSAMAGQERSTQPH